MNACNRSWPRRTAPLILLGVLIEASYVRAIALGAPYPGGPGRAHLRIAGILQRIGLCYGLAGVVLAATARRRADGLAGIGPAAIVVAIAVLLVGYTLLLALMPAPGFGAGQLTPMGNLPGFVDRTLFTEPHLWPLGSASGARPATCDPEGLLSTLPATANVLLGALAGWALRRYPVGAAMVRIAAVGVLLIAAGLALDPLLPILERIWTASFALFSGGVSALALAALVVVLPYRPVAWALAPLRVLGGNAILAFLLSTAMSRIAGFPILTRGGRPIAPQPWGYGHVLALVTALLWPLHRRAVHVRL